jgi:pimeloyl-ACP methyl ester carboxylesterase
MKRLLRAVVPALIGLAALYAALGLYYPDWALEAEYGRLRWLAQADVREVEVAEHRWSYVESGRGPLIVLVHGFTGNKETWLPVMRELRHDYRLIALDLPGWNASQRIKGADYGVAAQARRVAEFIAALDQPLVLLGGHSMGGHIAGLVAAEYPDRVPRLLLMSSAGTEFEANDFLRAVQAGEHPYAVQTRADLHRQLALVFTDPPFVPWPADEAMTRRRAADQPLEVEVLAQARGPEATLLQQRLADVQSPTLLLWCRDDKVIDVSAEAVFRRGLGRSQSVLLEGCGHMPLMAAPGEVAAALREFLPVVR